MENLALKQSPGLVEFPVPAFEDLHPEAHVSLEVLSQLTAAIPVGNPSAPDWMGNMINTSEEGDWTDIQSPEFKDFYSALTPEELTEIQGNLNLITFIANYSAGTPEEKYVYQYAEMRIMNIVQRTLEKLEFNNSPDSSMLWLAMRGAGIFQPMFDSWADHSFGIEMKRLRLKATASEVGEPYSIGIGAEFLQLNGMEGKEIIKSLILPDDCISTGMSQAGGIEVIFATGFRPDELILPVTVATTRGINFLSRFAKQVKERYGHDFRLVIAPGGLCYSVNESMYLSIPGASELQLVGDMGSFNENTEYGVPTGKSPLPLERICPLVKHGAAQVAIELLVNQEG